MNIYIMVISDIRVLLKKAQALELSRYNLYKNNANKVINPDGKNALISLAYAEKKHLEILKKQFSILKRKNKLDLKYLSKSMEKNYQKSNKRFNSTINAITGDINIIKASLKMEKYDAPFYLHLSKRTNNKDAKNLFLILKKEEEKHFKSLKNKLNDLEDISFSLTKSKKQY